MKIKRSVIAGMFIPFVLSACAGSAPKDTYDLGFAQSVTLPQQKLSHTQILIPTPAALKALDGQDILVSGNDNAIEYLKNAQWGDRLPNLVQSRLVQAFENTGKLAGVGRPGDGLAINYQVLTDIRSFGAKVSSARHIAYVEIAVKIMNDRNGSIKASKVFSSTQTISGQSNDQFIKAINAAFLQVTSDIVSWTLSNL